MQIPGRSARNSSLQRRCLNRIIIFRTRAIRDRSNIGAPSIDLLGPILRFDFFDGDRQGLFAAVQDIHHVFGDLFGESSFLRPDFPGTSFTMTWGIVLLGVGVIYGIARP